MTLFPKFTLSQRRSGAPRHKAAAPAHTRRGSPAATLTRDELLREVIAVIG